MSDQPDKVSNTVQTADGTLTLRDRETNELYHNSGGALLEAVENYVKPARLETLLQRRSAASQSAISDNQLSGPRMDESTLRFLDVCFGLGYNTFAVWQHVLNAPYLPFEKIEATAIELDVELLKLWPAVLRQDCFQDLNDALRDQSGKTISDNLEALAHIGVPPTSVQFRYQAREGPPFVLNMMFADLREAVPKLANEEPASYDLIFHDPFSPRKMQQFWTVELFIDYFNLLRPDCGAVLTYSAASAVRAGLIEAGFSVFRTNGVGVKNGGTLACRTGRTELVDGLIFHMLEEELERLKTVSGIPYRDPSRRDSTREVLKRRDREQKLFKAKHSQSV
jgi:chorismate dehydratase